MSRMEYLWQQYLGKKASDAELEELFTLIADPARREEHAVFLESLAARTSPVKDYDPKEWQFLIDAALDKLPAESELRAVPGSHAESEVPAETEMTPVRRIPFFSRPLTRIAAAAIILIAIGGVTEFILHKNYSEKPSNVITTPAPDIAPGGNKAILTLSNGSKIILDSAANGTLATQGNSNIIKTDSGKLLYSHVGTPLSQGRGAGGEENMYNTLSTPRGGQYQLTLPDGTKVWLNAASSITYPTAFTGESRKVSITGEAYFEVVHNNKQPFSVTVNGMDVKDIGTHFNINAYPDEQWMNTTLLEGKVEVTIKNQIVTLTPGQQSQARNDVFNIIQLPNPDKFIAWKNGLFNFQDVKLEEAMRQLSRWYDIDVVYEKNIPDIEFGGTIKQDLTLSHLLKLLEGAGVHFRIEQGRKLVVLP
jgi:transmembrane sensor